MDLASFIGFFGAFAIILMGGILGGSASGFFHLPSVFITVGGSYLTLFLAYPLSYTLGIFKVCARVFKSADFHEKEIVQRLYALAEKSRRTGLLALEEEIQDFDDEFMRTGLRNVVDGIDGEAIRNLMENELSHMEERHNRWISFINAWATLAPGYGMLGTVMGLIGMLMALEDKSSLGQNMAVALVTTLYGSLMANWLLIPMATKLGLQHEAEVKSKEMIIEGVLAIQAGDHPRILAQRLLVYLNPKDKRELEAELIKD
ncbi:motility protein A [Treponema phagedenis]|uniref:Motility protein A n=2 Tax=Treponema phagedenis TaxID=162 RepID=MOTA_TREPH|nr:motility protein A [Treponema phagedenis]Q56331.1 RecName: Full=Motility protein A; AltName: Full=Chemotaxis protein MotA [Treponema phagedenis]AAB03250.1 MotA [Treponema phagedenis]EFW36742.1 transporter, MotA/TolQ/ExbB proton channel family protein [Treponema phagedenis F0421]NVP24117.1 motility protein A [Treponema phagedenis]QEJ96257.1 motility protein A [Treponema phagedenis]QEJ99320.1 motility protein A [Treponema phagedenis]